MKQMMVELHGGGQIAEQMSEVIKEYRSGDYNRILLHVYSGFPIEDRLVAICRDLRDCFGTDLIVGTMSAGEILNGELINQGIMVTAMMFRESDVNILRYDGLRGREAEIGREIRRTLDAIPSLKGVEMLLPGTEIDTQHMYAEISKCRKDILIFGGYTGSQIFSQPSHFVFDASGIMNDAMLLVTFAGENLHIDGAKSIGWQAMGRPFKVTRADGKHLIELDGKPAAEVYEKYLQIDRKQHNNSDEALEFPMIAKLDGDERLRSVAHIKEDGSMILHGFVTEGMDMHLSCGNPSVIVEKVNERLEELRLFRPEAILLISCVVRRHFWENLVDMEMKPFGKVAPTAGFHTWGEVLRVKDTGDVAEHNITMLSIGMREGDAPQRELPKVRINDTVLQGQASVLRRMTRLVYATMDELQKAYNDLSVLNAKLTVMAEHDALTGLYNRGTIEKMIEEALDRSAESGKELSLIMVDLDHFKLVNDTYGHMVGDAVLQHIAGILSSAVEGRNGAGCGRWGGEEFFLLLPDTDAESAMALAEQLRLEIDKHCFPAVGHMTASIGVITTQGTVDRKELYVRVDDALYEAKESGRNRVIQAALIA